MKSLTISTNSPQETEKLGKLLGLLISPRTFIAMNGELGGGKTCFTRGIVASAAPESARLVASPTFAIMNEYPASIPVRHFDFYRFASSGDIEELGFEDYFFDEGICVVEWAEKLKNLLPEERLEITFFHLDDNDRNIVFTACGLFHEDLLERFADAARAVKNALT